MRPPGPVNRFPRRAEQSQCRAQAGSRQMHQTGIITYIKIRTIKTGGKLGQGEGSKNLQPIGIGNGRATSGNLRTLMGGAAQ